MKLTQQWIGYLDRSYQQIKQSVLNRIPANNPELTDFSESNPLIMLVGIFSAIGEVINLYIDAMARECFLGTMRKYTSALRLVKLIDCRVKAVICPSVDLTFTLINSGVPTPYLVGSIDIPLNVEVDSIQNSIPFISQQPGSFRPGDTQISIPFKSYSTKTGINLGTSDGTANQTFILEKDYAHGSLSLLIGSDTWIQYDSLGYLTSLTKGFIVDILDDGNPYLIFGDGINGAIPVITSTITGTYRVSVGQLGNLPPGAITKLISSISLPTGYSLQITNPGYSVGGADIQGLSDIRNTAPRDLRTLKRAVTHQDYIDLAIISPGVGYAELKYCCCCSTKILIYLAPLSKGIATAVLINDTRINFENKRIIGRAVSMLPAGLTRIWLDLSIVAAQGIDIPTCEDICILTLDTHYGYSGSDINRKVQPADFISVLKALTQVESVSLNAMYLEPYARPVNSDTPLLITWGPIHTAVAILYKLYYDYNGGAPRFILYKNNLFYSYIDIATPYADGLIINFIIYNSGLYVDGMEWTFKVYPSYPESFLNYQLAVDDYSVPIVDVDFTDIVDGLPAIFSNLTVTTSTSTSNCVNC